MRYLLTLIALASLVSAEGVNCQQTQTATPDDVSYSTINSSTMGRFKRSLDIRLNKRVSEGSLRAIALKLKALDWRTYDKTYIAYYLPGMVVNAGAWATTHFSPNLEVRILGLTPKQLDKILAEPLPANDEIIGSWLDDRPYVGFRITIFRKDGKLFVEQVAKDGSRGTDELIETKAPQGRRFDEGGGSSFGDHWVLGSDGNLQFRDNDGLYYTAKKVE